MTGPVVVLDACVLVPNVGVLPEQAGRRVAQMREAFGAGALIDDFDDLVEQMRCDSKDRHVLAAAVRGGADVVLTFNLKDFPPDAGAPFGIEVWHPDAFLIRLLGEDSDAVVAALKRETAAFHNPPETIGAFLATLTATVPVFANLARIAVNEMPGQVPTMPA